MILSDKGFDVLHEREGLKLKAYKDSVGVPTIGLGHTSAAGPPEVAMGMEITEDEAEEIFRRDCETFRKEVAHYVKTKLTQHEHDAVCSFLFNIGSTQFLKSTFLKKLNAGDKKGAAEELLKWNKPSEIKTRRRAEYEQFKHGRYVARVV